MQQLNLIKSSEFSVYLMESYTGPIAFLYNFLIDVPMQFLPSYYIEWALDPKEIYGETNSTSLTKKNSHILIGSLFSDEPNGGPFFEISINEFIKVLIKWEELLKAKPKEITLHEANGVITIES